MTGYPVLLSFFGDADGLFYAGGNALDGIAAVSERQIVVEHLEFCADLADRGIVAHEHFAEIFQRFEQFILVVAHQFAYDGLFIVIRLFLRIHSVPQTKYSASLLAVHVDSSFPRTARMRASVILRADTGQIFTHASHAIQPEPTLPESSEEMISCGQTRAQAPHEMHAPSGI